MTGVDARQEISLEPYLHIYVSICMVSSNVRLNKTFFWLHFFDQSSNGFLWSGNRLYSSLSYDPVDMQQEPYDTFEKDTCSKYALTFFNNSLLRARGTNLNYGCYRFTTPSSFFSMYVPIYYSGWMSCLISFYWLHRAGRSEKTNNLKWKHTCL